MITGELRNKVDKIWETFWTGGLTNPLEVIEQFTYLLFAMIESGIRAELGTELGRPMGSPNVLSPWNKLLLNPKQLHELPTASLDEISTKTVIAKNAKRPLVLDIPIIITGMSYGGSLSLLLKMALAKGSKMAGTSTNTGESAITNEERDNAKYLIGQFNRGGWITKDEELNRLDDIEMQQYTQGCLE